MHLEKYHALGNDFLILLDPDGKFPVDGEVARRVCNRHRGVGADGLIRATTDGPEADWVMELYNADGSRAEMSGNGIRCLARALVDVGMAAGSDLTVRTDAGARRVGLQGDGSVRVDMGPAEVGDERHSTIAGWRLREVLLGNPHLVLLCPNINGIHVSEFGPELEGLRPGGINVEFIETGAGDGELSMRVWERGAGETEACGTGSCAAAAAAHAWDLVGTRVVVHNPGGDLEVELGDTVHLTGPAEHVATVELAS